MGQRPTTRPDAEADGYSWGEPAARALRDAFASHTYPTPRFRAMWDEPHHLTKQALQETLRKAVTRSASESLRKALAGHGTVDKPDQSSIATEAHAAVYGDREDDYGHPSVNFERTAALWTTLLSDKLSDGQTVTPQDVGRAMIAAKLSRDVNDPMRDNRVDIAGYAITLDRLETGQ